ncbi:hypothetical protein ABZT03_35745 [Streptomyces sp. NPDC005574]|uniref:hypothetical protein n=1 Tax=Streptomyces sp. NPDC005574 TaxID=3156891 RepID=UPI0033B78FA2
MDMVAETWREGRAGTLLRTARVLTVAGAAGAVLLGEHRAAAVTSGLALLAGSACTRFGVFAAGVASARDPEYTVLPQREHLERRRAEEQAGRED